MSSASLPEVLRYVQGLAAPEGGSLNDGELLCRFIERRDEEAFAAILGRPGAIVLAVCRRVLGDDQDVESAFLVLARKVGSIRRQESLAAWMHRFALSQCADLVGGRQAPGLRRCGHDRPVLGRQLARMTTVTRLLKEWTCRASTGGLPGTSEALLSSRCRWEAL